ncbi:MAG: nuclear transport factor 2 family protein [Gammaproteobacteria bacterium]
MKKMIKTWLTAGALLVLFTGMPSFAQEHDVLQRMADREAIEELMWRYTRALDSFDPDAYVAVFTEDGSFGDIKGRDALHEMMSDFRDGRAQQTAEGNTPAPMFHATENYWTEFVSPTHARHHAYWVTYFGANGPDSPARMIAVGRGVDDLVKVNGQWLIQSRNVAPTAE